MEGGVIIIHVEGLDIQLPVFGDGDVFITVTESGLFDVMAVGDSYIGCFDSQGIQDAQPIIERRMTGELWVDQGKAITKYETFDKFLSGVNVVTLENGFINTF